MRLLAFRKRLIKQREKGATKGQWGKEKNGCGEDETGTGSL